MEKAIHDKKKESNEESQRNHASLVLNRQSSLSFDLAPKLVLIPPRTNLYDTPASWLVYSSDPEHSLTRIDTLAEFIDSQERDSGETPDFATDNMLLRDLFSWQFSDKMVSVIVQKFGNTLVLQSMNPLFTGPPSLPQYSAQLISGFNIMEPETSLARAMTSTQATPLEEQSRLKAKANEEMQRHLRRKKNLANQKRAQLMSKLHCRIMEQNDFRAIRPEGTVSIHRWHHKDHCVALASNLMVYSYRKRLTSLSLRDERDGPHSKASIARLFLDNIMAGVPQLAICWHDDGVIRKYDTMKTHEIPERLSQDEPLDISELEKTATAQLAFLKAMCQDDLSVHWLFKGEGDNIARLWRLDPLHDCSLDWAFRDKVLYQLAMFCLRASHHNTSRRLELLAKCAELLDAAANITWNESLSSSENPLDGSNHKNLRRALRAGVRERVVDVTLEIIRYSTVALNEKLLSLIYAIDSTTLGIRLLVEEESQIGECTIAANALLSRMKGRMLLKRLLVLLTAVDIVQKAPMEFKKEEMLRLYEVSRDVLLEYLSDTQCIESSCDRAEALRLFNECRLHMGGLAMRLARLAAQVDQPNWEVVENFVAEATDIYYAGVYEYMDISSLERQRALGLQGNALNELGKLRIARGALFDAIESFRNAISIFESLTDIANVELVRCNIAHCYRVAAAHVQGDDVGKKVTLLRLAENELQVGLDELKATTAEGLGDIKQKLIGEIFRTRIQIGVLLKTASDALLVFEKALECATCPEEIALTHYHIGRAYSDVPDPISCKLARRHLQKALENVFNKDDLRVKILCALGRLEERPEAKLRLIIQDERVLFSDLTEMNVTTELQDYISQAFQRWIRNNQSASKIRQAYEHWLSFIARKTPSAPVSVGVIVRYVKESLK